jgi:hypothetical protein
MHARAYDELIGVVVCPCEIANKQNHRLDEVGASIFSPCLDAHIFISIHVC